jgi:hypothetical protein
LKQIEKTFSRLSKFPDRGTHPKELLALGIREYREVFFKPYRIIYPGSKKPPRFFAGMDECANGWPGCRPSRA